MTLFKESDIRLRAKSVTKYNLAESELTKIARAQSAVRGHDVFLSHAFSDRELVLGIALTLEDLGYSVYIDWRDDPDLVRSRVSSKTANELRSRMKNSKCLLYSITNNASDSKWMPWELGFKDGDNSRVAILPIVQNVTSAYIGQEYLGIYPYVEVDLNTNKQQKLWVSRSSTCYILFDAWLDGKEPYERSE